MKSVSAVVLLSSGLDSSFNLLKASKEHSVLALSFNYGQKAARQELRFSHELASHFGAEHVVVDLPWFREFTKTSLVGSAAVPVGASVQIDSEKQSIETAKQVWVPNRNGIFLNIAAGFAEGRGASVVIPGFNLEEAQTFPDNSAGYMKALDGSFAFSTQNKVTVNCYSTQLTKTEIVKEAKASGLPFEKLWVCYLDGDEWCGQCESCQRNKRAMTANGVDFDKVKRKT